MSRSRMFGSDTPGRDEPEEPASPRKTIVGGRPPEKAVVAAPVPTGIQRLLRLAAADAAFRARLLERRDDVAAAAGVELTPTERAVLRAASPAQLEAMAEHLPPPPAPRREFFRQTAATAAALLAGPALLACEKREERDAVPGIKGIQPDMPPPKTDPEFAEPPPRPDADDMQTDGGVTTDEPPPPPPDPSPRPAGARPDLPPKPPKPSNPTRGIRPDLPPEKK